MFFVTLLLLRDLVIVNGKTYFRNVAFYLPICDTDIHVDVLHETTS